MVAPLIAAFEAAMMVKSLPVNPSRTSLFPCQLLFFSKRPEKNVHLCDIEVEDSSGKRRPTSCTRKREMPSSSKTGNLDDAKVFEIHGFTKVSSLTRIDM